MRARVWFGGLAAIGLALLLHSTSGRAAGAACSEPKPKTSNYWEDVANPRECELLNEYPGVVRRSDVSLTVKLKNGTTVYYYDNPYAHIIECGLHDDNTDDCLIFRVWDISPDRRYVTLKLGYYEGGSALLVDRQTGAELPLNSEPFLSPSGRYWAVVDSAGGYGAGVMDVVGRRSGRPSIIASADIGLCDFERWDSDTSFLVTCYDDETDVRAEQRVTWNRSGTMSMSSTGRVPADF